MKEQLTADQEFSEFMRGLLREYTRAKEVSTAEGITLKEAYIKLDLEKQQ
ncbi:hypothetical protein HUN01_28660 [Nostoc edaphicum CCNP1411]|uniref:Uncharacterized protein n=1 Tax=Nostoc edaphicum CCNP1411 TaxID=1472755 RepID=A0A7D7QBB7_9NOSO|nr:hypothetical protein [Nostoc edaphicum]QMS91377.1 hypothetical protein HUN01_28660 [Nostoc edaphicum CCNP1411]